MIPTATKSRPIIFSTEMVRAILDGRKSQSRRVVKPQPRSAEVQMLSSVSPSGERYHYDAMEVGMGDDSRFWACPYGKPGDTLYVKEKWIEGFDTGDGSWSCLRPDDFKGEHGKAFYFADANDPADGPQRPWRSPRFMPRWASRITLEITDVRVERVQEINEADIIAEGFHGADLHGFRGKWDALNAKRGFSWESNPFVWVLSFRRPA